MAKLIMRATGLDGIVELMADRVVIHRPGVFNLIKYGMNSTREIPLGAISEVVFRPAKLSMGKLEFVRGGRSSDEKKIHDTSVKFNRKSNDAFERIKEKTFELMNQLPRQK